MMKRLTAMTRHYAAVSFFLLGPCAASAVFADAASDSATYFFNRVLSEPHPRQMPSAETSHAPAETLQIWQGENGSNLKGTFKAQAAYYSQGSSWFGQAAQNLGDSSGGWWDNALTPGMQGSYFLSNSNEIYGRVSLVMANTDGTDAAGSNVNHGKDASDTRVEDAYIGWRSGDMFSSLGKDFLDVSFGRQQYVAGTGFLFFNESSNGKNRGAYWIGERRAAQFAGIVRMKTDRWQSDLVYLEGDDNPDSSTKVAGITLDYTFSDKLGSIGGGVYRADSDIDTRDSMKLYDARFSLTPFQAFAAPDLLSPLRFDGEYVYEDNGDKLQAAGWYLSAAYVWDQTSWKPGLTYRYASFEGDNPNSSKSQNFDPLFYGFYDWGYWYQGEVLGEYVLANSNLNSHMLRLNVKPVEDVSINFFYYIFKLDNAAGFGVQSSDFADEADVTIDWAATKHLSFSLVGAYVNPDDGAKEYTGGNDDWTYGMLYTNLSF